MVFGFQSTPVLLIHVIYLLVIEGFDFRHTFHLGDGTFVDITKHQVPMIAAPVSWIIWRAPIDNDRPVQKKWTDEGYDRAKMKLYRCEWTQQAEGSVDIVVEFSLGGYIRYPLMHGTTVWHVNTNGIISLRTEVKVREDLIYYSVVARSHFKFLGFALGKNRSGVYIRVHGQSIAKAKKKLKEFTRRSQGRNVRQVMEKVKIYIRGWIGYYYVADMKRILQSWSEWLRRRLRMYIWKGWKKPRTKVQNLRKLGIPEWQAYQWGNSRMGYWRIAGSRVLSRSITNEKLVKSSYRQDIMTFLRNTSGYVNCT